MLRKIFVASVAVILGSIFISQLDALLHTESTKDYYSILGMTLLFTITNYGWLIFVYGFFIALLSEVITFYITMKLKYNYIFIVLYASLFFFLSSFLDGYLIITNAIIFVLDRLLAWKKIKVKIKYAIVVLIIAIIIIILCRLLVPLIFLFDPLYLS